MWDSWCGVCARPTDHFGEHDGLVAAGLAEYDTETGSVRKTDLWDEAMAKAVSDAEYEAYVEAVEAGSPLDYDMDEVLAEADRRYRQMWEGALLP